MHRNPDGCRTILLWGRAGLGCGWVAVYSELIETWDSLHALIVNTIAFSIILFSFTFPGWYEV